MKKSRHPWVVIYDATGGQGKKQPYTMECRRCFAIEVPFIPLPVNDFVRLAKSFERQHTKCAPRPTQEGVT